MWREEIKPERRRQRQVSLTKFPSRPRRPNWTTADAVEWPFLLLLRASCSAALALGLPLLARSLWAALLSRCFVASYPLRQTWLRQTAALCVRQSEAYAERKQRPQHGDLLSCAGSHTEMFTLTVSSLVRLRQQTGARTVARAFTFLDRKYEAQTETEGEESRVKASH